MMDPLILALHGALSGPAVWQALPIVPAAADFHAWDLLADIDAGVAGFEDWADGFGARATDLAAGRPIVLLGYSLGARLAMAALAHCPASFAGALLVSGHPGLAEPTVRAARLAEDLGWAARVRQDAWPELVRAWEARPVFATGKPLEQWQAGIARAWQEDRVALQARRTSAARALDIWSLGRQPDFRAALAACRCPVLWLTGAEDVKFHALAAEAVRQANRAGAPSWHQSVPAAGHRVPWECPDALSAAIQALGAKITG